MVITNSGCVVTTNLGLSDRRQWAVPPHILDLRCRERGRRAGLRLGTAKSMSTSAALTIAVLSDPHSQLELRRLLVFVRNRPSVSRRYSCLSASSA